LRNAHSSSHCHTIVVVESAAQKEGSRPNCHRASAVCIVAIKAAVYEAGKHSSLLRALASANCPTRMCRIIPERTTREICVTRCSIDIYCATAFVCSVVDEAAVFEYCSAVHVDRTTNTF
jgi:hypothetical protein